MKIYYCPICGNIVTKLEEYNGVLKCCDTKMEVLPINKEDGAHEKHLPTLEEKGPDFLVKVGEIAHPMTEEHYIKWILVERTNGFSFKKLTPNDKPEAIFTNIGDVKSIYSYCNLHGLYRVDK